MGSTRRLRARSTVSGVMRQCSRSGCSESAAVTLTYQYSHAQVWLDTLALEREPHAYDMCDRHAGRLDGAPGLAGPRSPAAGAAEPDRRLNRYPPPPWSPTNRQAVCPIDAAAIPFGAAAGTWALGWVVGSIVVTPLLVAALGAELGDDLSIPQLLVVAIGAWAVFLVALLIASRRFGTGRLVGDYAARFRPIDLVGVPVGVLTQLLLIPLLYQPLRLCGPTPSRANGSSSGPRISPTGRPGSRRCCWC